MPIPIHIPTSDFYIEYLQSIRRATQNATVKPEKKEYDIDTPAFYDSSYYFGGGGGSKSHKHIGIHKYSSNLNS
jgi:hypothetical protein